MEKNKILTGTLNITYQKPVNAELKQWTQLQYFVLLYTIYLMNNEDKLLIVIKNWVAVFQNTL